MHDGIFHGHTLGVWIFVEVHITTLPYLGQVKMGLYQQILVINAHKSDHVVELLTNRKDLDQYSSHRL